jgi:predicted nucleic acid-binding protein
MAASPRKAVLVANIGRTAFVALSDLAVSPDHHLFDTLYRAVAMIGLAATLVTADLRYYRKTRHLGAICKLAEFRNP